ncbi:hypothetical protein B0H14DRAFT_3530851 [Mycena olivaceomarginata]|nr:hypothetical protein B0H14DRAFT_3530851 [Mycena olivaceomarginata]
MPQDDLDPKQRKAVKGFVEEWTQENHTQGPAAVMYTVSGRQHIFQNRDRAVAVLKRSPGAELLFTNDEDELFEFLAEDLEGKLQGRQRGAGSQREPVFMPTRQGGTRGPRSNPNRQSYVVRMGNANRAVLSMFMDGLEAAQAQGEQPAPPYASSDIPDLVPIEEPEVVRPLEEGLSPSARARLEQARSEIARTQQ